MTRNVIITVTGTHETDGIKQEPVVTTANGRHFVQNGKHYLLYDEMTDGADGVVKNVVKFNEQMLEVTKKGALESKMTFEKGKMNITHYKTPAGILELGMTAKQIVMTQSRARVEIRVDYELHAGGRKVQDSTVIISAVQQPIV
ncbi:MAG: DUF1934 domain-containing protein [Firmicutes bacterium]|nr:DUF1934 domain-containing protein [Bacillota bacterium]